MPIRLGSDRFGSVNLPTGNHLQNLCDLRMTNSGSSRYFKTLAS
jgi:hypothetical protein